MLISGFLYSVTNNVLFDLDRFKDNWLILNFILILFSLYS